MTSEWYLRKEKELNLLKDIYKTNPELFARRSFVDDAPTLARFGIIIPGKETMPESYIKLYPSDFIVEEIDTHNVETTIGYPAALPPLASEHGSGYTVYATLVKCAASTIDAVEDIREMLSCDRSQIRYAGIKDKDAITSQRISIRNVVPARVLALRSPNFFLKDLSIGKGTIEKGALSGNRFTILIRPRGGMNQNIERYIHTRVEDIAAQGIYNFYYLQRFGTVGLRNFIWGRYILEGNPHAAIMDYLTFIGERELPFFSALREEIRKRWGDFVSIAKILKAFPVTFASELRLVTHLINHPLDWTGALRAIEEQTQLWVYGFSSWLFNTTLSRMVVEGEKIPSVLPLILSFNPRDLAVYEKILREIGMFPLRFENLKPFPFLRLAHREVLTKSRPKIESLECIPEGFVISFVLGRGEYATTFLAHMVNILWGTPPSDIKTELKDILRIVTAEDNEDIRRALEYFKPIIKGKHENLLAREE